LQRNCNCSRNLHRQWCDFVVFWKCWIICRTGASIVRLSILKLFVFCVWEYILTLFTFHKRDFKRLLNDLLKSVSSSLPSKKYRHFSFKQLSTDWGGDHFIKFVQCSLSVFKRSASFLFFSNDCERFYVQVTHNAVNNMVYMLQEITQRPHHTWDTTNYSKFERKFAKFAQNASPSI